MVSPTLLKTTTMMLPALQKNWKESTEVPMLADVVKIKGTISTLVWVMTNQIPL